MWREFTADGSLRYGNFLETVLRIVPMYATRAAGGTIFMTGALIAIYNLYRTARQGHLTADEAAEAPPLRPLVPEPATAWHRTLEAKPTRFAVLTLLAVVIGGVVEYVPTALVRSNVPTIATVKPYTPLEIEGRDLYIREGCVGCHSQMVRPIRAETERYGDYSKAGEFVYDHPFLWGSKRTGPDLQRLGGKYPDSWHYVHMRDPKATSPGSIMPGYPWLYDDAIDESHVEGKVITLRRLGVPYEDGYEQRAVGDLRAQAQTIADGLKSANIEARADREIIALIAYLQRLGKDAKAAGASASLTRGTR
jgi:cytochrome c oxidase cbb3-type subunit I/II